MADLFWLTKAKIRRIAPYFALSRGVPPADDQRVDRLKSNVGLPGAD